MDALILEHAAYCVVSLAMAVDPGSGIMSCVFHDSTDSELLCRTSARELVYCFLDHYEHEHDLKHVVNMSVFESFQHVVSTELADRCLGCLMETRTSNSFLDTL